MADTLSISSASAAVLSPFKEVPFPFSQHEQDVRTSVEGNEVDLDSLIRDAASDLVRRIQTNLDEDVVDATASSDLAPSPDAVKACLWLAEHISPRVALAPGIRFAAFTEDDGVVALVLHSLATDRRLTCRVSQNGATTSVHRIDENMKSLQGELITDFESTPRELAEWVMKRA